MLDEMKFKLGSKFMRKMASKFISNILYKKFGYKIDVKLDELNINFEDGDTTIKTNIELKMDKMEFTRLMKDVDEL